MRAIFLDRDGTVIVDPPDERVDTEEKIQLLPNSLEGLKALSTLDYGVFFVTNQAGIAEGRITVEEFWRLHNIVLEKLAPSEIKILKTYLCPHAESDGCECRKPKPKLLLDAAKEFNIDLRESWMIGDRESDVMAGVNAGTKTVLVQTGLVVVESTRTTHTADSLLEAIQFVAKQN